MTTFLDTNVLIYMLSPDSQLHSWAKAAAATRRLEGPLIISDVVFSEISVAFDTVEATRQVVDELKLELMRFSFDSLFSAGKAYKKYREELKGTKERVLPDFLIAAQAAVSGMPLLTADDRNLSRYFPGIAVMNPRTYDPQVES